MAGHVSEEKFLAEERKKVQTDKLREIHANNKDNAKRRRTVSLTGEHPAFTHTSDGAPVLHYVFDAGGSAAASTGPQDGVLADGGADGSGNGKDKEQEQGQEGH